jgi:hypothetical protein
VADTVVVEAKVGGSKEDTHPVLDFNVSRTVVVEANVGGIKEDTYQVWNSMCLEAAG